MNFDLTNQELKKITIHVTKDKNKVKTQIYNLEKYILNDNYEKVFKDMKKKLGCGGAVQDNIITLQGDHKEFVINFLTTNKYATQDNIEIKGI